jgi:hypothetical protein
LLDHWGDALKPVLMFMLVCLIPLTGCYKTTWIHKSDAVLLNRVMGEKINGIRKDPVIIKSVLMVKGEDGKRVKLKGAYNVRVVLKNGKKLHFTHPVDITREGDVLFFSRVGSKPIKILGKDIKRVGVLTENGVKSAIIIGVSLAVFIALSVTVIFLNPTPILLF